MKKLLTLMVFICVLAAMACTPACKAQRSYSTTATYTLTNDSTSDKSTVTITTKTVEDYQGNKK